jgi:hypothetical protein
MARPKVTEKQINFLTNGADPNSLIAKRDGTLLPAIVAEYSKHMRHVDRWEWKESGEGKGLETGRGREEE